MTKNKFLLSITSISLLILIVLQSIPMLALGTVQGDCSILHDFSAQCVSDTLLLVDTLENREFTSKDNSVLISQYAKQINQYPYTGINCGIHANSVKASSQWNYIECYNGDGWNLSNYDNVIIPINFGNVLSGLEVRVEIASKRNTFIFTSSDIDENGWNGIICNISRYEDIKDIHTIRIGTKVAKDSDADYTYYISGLFASSENSTSLIEQKCYMLSNKYYVSGGDNSVSYDSKYKVMHVSINGSKNEYCSLYSGTLQEGVFDNAQAIKIKLVNYSGSGKLSLEYATKEQQSFKQNPEIEVTIDPTTTLQTVYFPIDVDGITEFKLTFDEVLDGNIDIYSISAASYYSSLMTNSGISTTDGAITSCKIDIDTNQVILKGSINADKLSQYKGMLLQLYEINATDNADKIFGDNSRPVKSINVAESFSFELPITKNRLGNKFAVVVYDNNKNQAILLSSPVYITNAELLGNNSEIKEDSMSKLGVVGNFSTLFDTNSQYTIIDLDIYSLAYNSNNDYQYSYENKEYYFSSSYISSISQSIQNAISSGNRVYLRLLDSSSSIGYYSIKNESSKEKYMATVSFVSETFLNQDKTYGVIFGSPLFGYSEGMQIRKYVDDYSSSFRVFVNVMRSVAGKKEIYIPLNEKWDGQYGNSYECEFYGRDVADLFNYQIKAEGNISYGFVIDPFSNNDYTLSSSSGKLVKRLNGFTLSEVASYLNQSKFLYSGVSRSIIVTDCNFEKINVSGNGYIDKCINQWTLTYRVATSESCINIKAIIYTPPKAVENDSSILDFLKTIDTTSNKSLLENALDYYKLKSWSDLSLIIPDSDKEIIETGVTYDLPITIVGKTDIWSVFPDSKQKYDYQFSTNILSHDDNIGYMGYDGVMKLTGSGEGAHIITMNFPYTRNFTPAPVLCFRLYAKESVSGKIRINTENGSIYFAFNLKEGKNDLVCDLSNYEKHQKVNSYSVEFDKLSTAYLIGVSANSYNNAESYINQKFTQEYNTYTTKIDGKTQQNRLIIAALSVVAAAVVFEIIYIAIRVRKNKKKSITSENEKYKMGSKHYYN